MVRRSPNGSLPVLGRTEVSDYARAGTLPSVRPTFSGVVVRVRRLTMISAATASWSPTTTALMSADRPVRFLGTVASSGMSSPTKAHPTLYGAPTRVARWDRLYLSRASGSASRGSGCNGRPPPDEAAVRLSPSSGPGAQLLSQTVAHVGLKGATVVPGSRRHRSLDPADVALRRK